MKIKLLAAVSAITLLSAPAMAGEYALGPYIGFDLQRSHIDYQSGVDDFAAQNLNGGDIHVGVTPFPNLGFELGYFGTRDAKKDNILGLGVDSKVKIHGFTLDALGYLPVTSDVKLIGMAGAVHSKAEAEFNGAGGSADLDESEWNWRLGAGAQYQFMPNLNARAMVKYQNADFDDTLDGIWTASLGLNLSF